MKPPVDNVEFKTLGERERTGKTIKKNHNKSFIIFNFLFIIGMALLKVKVKEEKKNRFLCTENRTKNEIRLSNKVFSVI